MQTAILPPSAARAPLWFLALAIGGIAWNVFGAVQFVGSLNATPESLQAQGLTAEHAMVMTGYPGWMTAAFAVGVFGGLLGSALLLIRHRLAGPTLAVSLAAYIALWVGDAVHGVFAALGMGQVVILSLVVAIAAGLYALSRHPVARA